MTATAENKEANRKLLTERRAAYMAGEVDHHAYYLWLADWIGVTNSMVPATADKIKSFLATDKHLNNISLTCWDNAHPWVTPLASAKGLPWSLSDTVCCLKAVARRMAEEE